MTASGLHLVFVSVWLGGLVTLVLIRGTLGPGRLVTVLARYSTLALVCFIVVAVSGYVSAEIRVGSIENILSPYGSPRAREGRSRWWRSGGSAPSSAGS